MAKSKNEVMYQPLHKILRYGLYSIRERDGKTKYVCNLCGKKFVSLDRLLEHIRKNHAHDKLPDVLPY